MKRLYIAGKLRAAIRHAHDHGYALVTIRIHPVDAEELLELLDGEHLELEIVPRKEEEEEK
jgi:hypothetical protein